MGEFVQGLGAAAGGGNTAGQFGGQALQTSAASTMLGVGGSIAGGIGGYESAKYAQRIAALNAQNAITAGQEQETASKTKYGALANQQIAGFAGQGVGVGGANVARTVQTTRDVGSIDAALIHYNAMRTAFGFKAEEAVDKSEAIGSLLKGGFGAVSSFIGGAAGLAGKSSAFGASGVGGGSGSGSDYSGNGYDFSVPAG